jgi:hypothetical protein
MVADAAATFASTCFTSGCLVSSAASAAWAARATQKALVELAVLTDFDLRQSPSGRKRLFDAKSVNRLQAVHQKAEDSVHHCLRLVAADRVAALLEYPKIGVGDQ